MILKMDYFKLYHTLKATKPINNKKFKHFFKNTAITWLYTLIPFSLFTINN